MATTRLLRAKKQYPEIQTEEEYYHFINKLFNMTTIPHEFNSAEPDENDMFLFEKIDSKAINIKNVKKIKFSSKPELSFSSAYECSSASTPREGYLFYCSEVDYIYYKYQKENENLPVIYRFENIVNVSKFIDNLFKYYDVPTSAYRKTTYQDENDIRITNFFISFKKDLFLYFDGEDTGVLVYNLQYEKDLNSMLYTVLGLLKNNLKSKVSKNKIYIVYRDSHGFEKIGFNVKKTKINLDENYNEGFIKTSENIINGLNNRDKTNLVILSGEPGVGKTTYVRYLTSKLKKNIIFISPDMVDSITDPAFIPFLMRNNDSVLIIEDAEPALEKRNNGGRSSAVSNVLNLTDGLLSDCLNISIVATFNTDKKTIDEALLRKGRLLMNYKFEKLCVDKSKKLLEKLGYTDVNVNEPMALSDIYFYGTDNNIRTTKTNKIGFK